MSTALSQKLENFPFQIILGSASPRRQELLKGLGFAFDCQPVNADESWPADLQAEQIPLYLSQHKSREFPRDLAPGELLITADTVVWCEGRIFNKPENFDDGVRMLSSLSNRMHEVFTAVTLRSAAKTVSFCDTSRVYFRDLQLEEIHYYLEKYRPYDKAGGYGVQDWIGYIAIDRIEGSFYNVMGLPVSRLYQALLAF